MLPASSISHPFLTVWATASKLLLGLLACGWLLLGLSWAVLHGAIVPRLDQFRPQLQSLATQATGLRVEIGELRAYSTGFFPSFELKQVRLLDDAGQTAAQLPQVLISLSPRSLLTASLDQVVVRGAELHLRRSADGRLWLAGIALTPIATQGQTGLADWLLSQREWALLDGRLNWTDEQQGVALALGQVDAVMRNPGQKHQLRIDATPPPEWGERFSLRGNFRQPLLSRSPSNWHQWSGQLYAQFSRVDLARLRAYARLAGLSLERGHGGLRGWVDVQQGRVTQASADVALDDVALSLSPQLPALALQRLSGRLLWQNRGERGLDLRTESLSLATADGLQWPGGNLALNMDLDAQGRPVRGKFQADRLDLQALSRLSQQLPLPPHWQQAGALSPSGRIEQIEASWQGPLDQPERLSVSGRLSAVSLAAQPESGQPGVAGLSLDFKLQRESGQDRGQASFSLDKGWLEFPGIFQEPRLELEKLSGELRLKRNARGIEVELRQASLLANDAQGQFQGSWKRETAGHRLGSLDLQGQLSRADGARIWRYLPETVPARVRDYLRQSVQQAALSQVRFKLKGALASFPFEAPGSGEFQVTARVRGGAYAYVPSTPGEAVGRSWPSLTQVDADLLFQGASLRIQEAQARVAGLPGLQLSRAEARIASLAQRPAVVEVAGEIKGPLAQSLALVNQTPLSDILQRSLVRATATGNADLQLKLSLPLDDLSRTRVQGLLTLPGNELQLTPEIPTLGRLRGTLAFSETGFQTLNAQAQWLGGEVRFEGGLRPLPRRGDEPELAFRGQGTASAEALRQWSPLQPLEPVLRQASGSASYSATLGLRQGQLELAVTSNLAGLELALPEPLNKPAAAAWPLRLERTLVRESLAAGRRPQDRLSLSLVPGGNLGQALSVSYLRDLSGAQPQVIHGLLSLGEPDSGPETPERGVRAQLQLPRLDLDAWQPLWSQFSGSASAGEIGSAYLPGSLNLRAGWFKAQGYSLQDLTLSGQREGPVWRARASASELSGQGEYRQASGSSPARLHARLSRLRLGTSAASAAEALPDPRPGSLPTLDLVVDELELRGKKLGRLEVEAHNLQPGAREPGREWQISRLRLSVPEAQLSATGSWATGPSTGARQGTQLNFKLEVADSGELLARLGMDGAIRRGKGRLEGQIGWAGSPLGLHYPSLQGQMTVDVESGQFLKADPGAARLLGVLNLQSLPRRLSLDFRDVFSEGFAFDWLRGDVLIRQGVAATRDLRMKGVNAAVLMEGSADLARETQDVRVVVVPEINAGTASLLAYAANPAMALGTFVAQWLLRQPLNEANTQEFQVSGPWSDPQIQRVPRQRPAAQTGPPGGTP